MTSSKPIHEVHYPWIIGNSPDSLGDRFTVQCGCGYQTPVFLSLRELLDAWGTHLTHETLTQVLDRQATSHRARSRAS